MRRDVINRFQQQLATATRKWRICTTSRLTVCSFRGVHDYTANAKTFGPVLKCDQIDQVSVFR